MGFVLTVRFVEIRGCRRPLNLRTKPYCWYTWFFAFRWRLKPDNYMGPGGAYWVAQLVGCTKGIHLGDRLGASRHIDITQELYKSVYPNTYVAGRVAGQSSPG